MTPRPRSHCLGAAAANSGPGYRFRHATIKTVAYERLPDDRRAELHERYADWLERETEDRRSQFDEIVGHHFYEAYRYARRLDPGGDQMKELARRAGERYAVAGQRAAVRGDTRLVQAWLGRAVRLLPAENPLRLSALPPLAEAHRATASSPRRPGPTRSWPGRPRRSATRAWPCTPPSAGSASPPSTTRASSSRRAATRSSWPSPPSSVSATGWASPRPGTCSPTWTGPGAG